MKEHRGERWRGVIRKYRDFLPVGEERCIVTLNEGWTPLIRAKRIQEALPRDINVYLKYEGLNPTGSFKDRGMYFSKLSIGDPFSIPHNILINSDLTFLAIPLLYSLHP